MCKTLVCSALVYLPAFTTDAMAGNVIAPLTTMRVASGLVRPLYAIAPPADYRRLFIVEQHGSAGVVDRADIRILDLTTNPPTLLPTPFLSVSGVTTGGEQGLLALAFHPNYWSNGYLYVNYTANGGGPAGRTVVARYQVSASPNLADPTSAQRVISFDQPFTNHNGGWIGFGPDGYLYVASGDGGGGGDADNHAQTIVNDKLGKLLRLDVNGDNFPADAERNYAIPPTNPFLFAPMSAGDDEIWAYGLRNPWRASFDRLTGDLWIGDVGQGAIEEVDFQPSNVAGAILGQPGYQGGRNYGWHCKEGFSCYDFGACCSGGPPEGFVDPILDYTQDSDPNIPGLITGRCVIGGYVYRGCAIPSLRGHYFFGDYNGDRIWSLTYSGGVISNFVDRTAELDPPGPRSVAFITSFGEDARGELYICDYAGEVFKIIPVTPTIVSHDLNCDGHVNGLDLAILLGAWGPCPAGGCLADFNGSGSVNGLDLAALLAAWVP